MTAITKNKNLLLNTLVYDLLLRLENTSIMKKIPYLFLALTLLLTSCTGEDGIDGVNIVGQSFERTTDLVAPNFEQTFIIPNSIELFESDMVLVYHLVGVDNRGYDIWRLMPDTVYTFDGQEFQYNYEHNFDLVTVFIEAPATFNFNSLLSGDVLDQTFRIVVLPVALASANNIDFSNINIVMQYVN